MKPPEREKLDFELVKTDDFIAGEIEQIQYDPEHVFKYKGEEKKAMAVRFKFKMDGYKFPHYSRWMSFSYGKESNLFKKYISSLIQNAEPDMDLDLDVLHGMKVKILWAQTERNGSIYQAPETIRPLNGKVKASDFVEREPGDDELVEHDGVISKQGDEIPL